VLIAVLLVGIVVYEKPKDPSIVVKPAPALMDDMPLTVVAMTVVYLEFGLDVKDALARFRKLVVDSIKGSEPDIEAGAKAAEAAVLDVAMPLDVFADVVALTCVLNSNGDDKLVLSIVAAAPGKLGVELETNIRLIVESPRTDVESAAFAIPINRESTAGRVATARSENEFSFRVFCDFADGCFVGVGVCWKPSSQP
jgi:hypothetical protein